MSSMTVWKHLIWKDFLQIKPLLLACMIWMAALQVLLTAFEMLAPSVFGNATQAAIAFALVAPTLSAVGCSGMLIGHERQIGTWAWCSSLPVSWRQALASKIVAWFLMSTTLLVVLLPLNMACVRIAGHSLDLSNISLLVPGYVLFIGFIALVFFFIATSVWNDTLLAMCVMGVALVLAQLVLLEIISPNLSRLYWTVQVDDSAGSRIANAAIVALAELLAGIVGMIAAFRWRWGNGQLSKFFAPRLTVARVDVAPLSARWQTFAASCTKPSESRVLLVNAIRGSLGFFALIAIVLAIPLFRVATVPVESLRGTWQPALMICWTIASILLGVSMFAGDQTLFRYRFLADRGALWRKVLWSRLVPRLIVIVLFVLTLMLLGYIRDYALSRNDYWDWIGLGMAGLCIGMLGSLCFSNSVMATTVTLLTAFAAALTIGGVDNAFSGLFLEDRWWLARWLPLSLAIGFGFGLYLTSRWLVWERIRGARIFIVAILTCICIPILLAVSTCFLLVPNVAWQGIELSNISVAKLANVPLLVGGETMAASRSKMLMLSAHIRYSPACGFGNGLTTVDDFEATVADVVAIQSDDGDKYWSEWKSLLHELQEQRDSSSGELSADSGYRIRLDRVISDICLVAAVATRTGKREIAIQAWELNRDLLRSAESSELFVSTLESRLITWGVWNELSNDDLKILGDSKAIKALIPNAKPDNSEVIELRRIRATLSREELRGGKLPLDAWLNYQFEIQTFGILRTIPFIRWRDERLLALKLANDIRVFSSDSLRTRENVHDVAARLCFYIRHSQESFEKRIASLEEAEKTRD